MSIRPLLMSAVKNTITNFNTQGLQTNVYSSIRMISLSLQLTCSGTHMMLIACKWKKNVSMKPILMSSVRNTIHFNK